MFIASFDLFVIQIMLIKTLHQFLSVGLEED